VSQNKEGGEMTITETGKYKLTQRWSARGSNSIAHYDAGFEFVITQVDLEHNHVIGPALPGWEYNDIPCERISEESK
jgi:hypothetical protein